MIKADNIFLDVNEIHNKKTQMVEVTLFGYNREEDVNFVIAEATGEAQRDPVDKYSPVVGFNLALGRAIQALGRKIEKRANGLVKHQDDMRALKEQKARLAQAKEDGRPSAFWSQAKSFDFKAQDNLLSELIEPVLYHGLDQSVRLNLPPLGALLLEPVVL